VLSLGPQHSFELDGVFDYLQPETARDVLVQALLASPMFETRWRGTPNARCSSTAAATASAFRPICCGMRRERPAAAAFPQVLACPETLAAGPIECRPSIRVRPDDRGLPHEAMDVDGFLRCSTACATAGSRSARWIPPSPRRSRAAS